MTAQIVDPAAGARSLVGWVPGATTPEGPPTHERRTLHPVPEHRHRVDVRGRPADHATRGIRELRPRAVKPCPPTVPRPHRGAQGRVPPVRPGRRYPYGRPPVPRSALARAGAPRGGACRPGGGRQLHPGRHGRRRPGDRRTLAAQGEHGGGHVRHRQGDVLSARRVGAHPAGANLARPAPARGAVHQLRPGAGLCPVQGGGALRRHRPRAPALPPGLDHRETLPERAPRRPGDGLPECAGTSAAVRQGALRGAGTGLRRHRHRHQAGGVARPARAAVRVLDGPAATARWC